MPLEAVQFAVFLLQHMKLAGQSGWGGGGEHVLAFMECIPQVFNY